MKKGDAGVNNLNRVIAGIVRDPVLSGGRAITRDDYELRAGDRIIWTMNDKDLGLFNGEIGTLVEVLPNNGATVEFNEQRYKVPPEKVGNFSLAYALTVHKVQGSQFPIAIIALDGSLAHGQALSLYSRRLVYTAVTRARKTVAVVGQLKVLREAVRRHDTHKRRTALRELVGAGMAPDPTLLASEGEIPVEELELDRPKPFSDLLLP
jgi:exodeoxyribonuclease V alpha subunit